jgi:hypothetical protein
MARSVSRRIETLLDHRIQTSIQRLDALDRCLDQFRCSDLAALDQIGEAGCVV